MKIIYFLMVIILVFAGNVYSGSTVPTQNQTQKQAQGQLQGQAQYATGGSSSPSSSSQANNNLNNDFVITQTNQRELLPVPEIHPIDIKLISGVLEVTNNWTQYDIPCTPLGKDEKVKAVLNVENGGFLTSIRIQEVDQIVIDGCKKALTKKVKDKVTEDKVRYRIWLKPSSKGAGIGGGATHGMSDLGATSGYSSSLGILPGFALSTVDPAFVVIYYLVK